MKQITPFLLIAILLSGNCIVFGKMPFQFNAKAFCKDDFTYQDKKTIENPTLLEYLYYKDIKMQNGSPVRAYVEKGKKISDDGDYLWMKTVPFYASNEVKCAYEYQMDFTDEDFNALKAWLISVMGHNVASRSVDNPSWYDDSMSLTESYKYCKENNSNITMQYFNKEELTLTTILIDSGSIQTNTSGEMAIVMTIYKQHDQLSN